MTKEALTLALEALKNITNYEGLADAREVIKEALAQPEQEPVVYWDGESRFVSQKTKEWDKRTGGTLGFGCDIALYTTPPQRTWVGLTDEERNSLYEAHHDKYNLPNQGSPDGMDYERAIEAKLKEKNT